MFRMIGLIIVLAIGIMVVASCSSSSPVDPQVQPVLERSNDSDGHMLWGYYSIYLDPAGPSVYAVPQRQIEKHFNVKQFVNPPNCNDCLIIQPTGPYTNYILPVNVTLKNPEGITGYDVRGILLSDDVGLDLDNPDAYTTLFDNGGPININPFKAYAKSEDNRAFGPGESFTANYQLYLSKFGKVTVIDYAVDASWPTRAKEPYELALSYTYCQLDQYGFETITFGFEVHAASDDVTEVSLDASALGFSSDIPATQTSPAIWEAMFENTPLAAAGDYTLVVKALSASSAKYLYNYIPVTVIEGTPPLSLEDDVQPIFDAHCISCHASIAPPLNLDLTEGNVYGNTVDIDSQQSIIKRITAGNVINSYLVAKIKGNHTMFPYVGTGERMPTGGPPWVSTENENIISDWVAQGALDN